MAASPTAAISVVEERDALRKRLEILHRADLILDRARDLAPVLEDFLELMMEAAQVESGTLYLVDREREEMVFAVVQGPADVSVALQGQRMQLGHGIVGKCALRGEPIWVPEVERSRDWARELAERSGYHPGNVLCLPLKAQEEVIGVVQLFDHPVEHPYTPADRQFLSVLVNDLALKMENARLLDTTRERAARLQALLEVGVELGATSDRYRLLNLILQKVCQLLAAEAASIFELDEETGELILSDATNIPLDGLEPERVPPGEGIAGWVAQHGKTDSVPDVRQDPRWYPGTEERTGFVTRSVLCTPLVIQEQVPGQEGVYQRRVIGVAQALNKHGDGVFTEDDKAIFEGLARQAAIAMERERRYREINELLGTTRERAARLQALLDVGVELGTTSDRDRLLDLILEQVCHLLQAEGASVFELEEETQELVLCRTTTAALNKLGTVRVPRGEGIAGWVAQYEETVLVPDVRQDPRWYPKTDELTSFVTRSILCTPLVVQKQVPGQEGIFHRRAIGVAQALNKQGDGGFNQDDIAIFEGLARQAAIAMERERLYRENNELYTSAIMVLAEAMEAKDPYTRGHLRQVTAISVAIAEELGLSAEEVARVRTAAMLHDIGKFGMPDAILRKPGRVDEFEREIIQRHPREGERILRPFHHLRDVIPGVAEHHERYDGGGYPRGLQGTKISLAGRIISVADTFDAMTSNRPYRPAMPVGTVLEEIQAQAGHQFDPKMVDAFMRAWEKGRIALPED